MHCTYVENIYYDFYKIQLNIKSYININIGTYCTQNKITVFAILNFILTFYFHTNLIKMTQLNSN